MCCKWKDGSTSWEKLPNLKELHSIQDTKYAIAQGIQHKMASNWWVHHVLKKRDQIISTVRWCSAQYLKRNHNFGLKLPKMVNEAHAIDEKKTPSGKVPYRKKWTMWRLYSKLYPRASSHQLGFTMSNATWCLTLKLRISKEKQTYWQEAI